MDLLLSLCVGIGLSAACGFRVFVPLCVLSLAALTGHVKLAAGFAWIGTMPAFWAFAIATVLEITGYFVPWLDHMLDLLATPAAIVAGTLITATMVADMSPFLRWSMAVIAGGGMAGAIQATTVALRGTSLAGTGGMGNPLVAAAELTGALITSVLAVFAPVFVVIVLALALMFVARKLSKWKRGRPTEAPVG